MNESFAETIHNVLVNDVILKDLSGPTLATKVVRLFFEQALDDAQTPYIVWEYTFSGDASEVVFMGSGIVVFRFYDESINSIKLVQMTDRLEDLIAKGSFKTPDAMAVRFFAVKKHPIPQSLERYRCHEVIYPYRGYNRRNHVARLQ